jgi:extracellular elastinolytic metalloproteinase
MTDARAPSAPDQDLTRLAIDHLRAQPASSDPSIGFLPDGDVQTTSSGIRVVHLHQEYRGIPVHGGSVAVHFDARGRFDSVAGEIQRISPDLTLTPQVTAPAAVLAAVRYVAEQVQASETAPAIKVSNRAPVQLGRFAHPSRPTMLHKPPFRDPVTARLVLFGPDARLAWEIHLRIPKAGGEWDAIVAADRPNEPDVLHAWQTLAHAAHGVVYELNPSEAARTELSFPCPRTYHPNLAGRMLPPGHEIWVSDGQTRGNNVISLQENSKRSYPGVLSNSDVSFEPADAVGMDQHLLNAFYITNLLHDFFLLLGFDEAAGNFQGRNFSGQGEDDDRLVVRIFGQAIPGIATMRSRRDGNSPELNLGLNGTRHTALDAEIVIHEYVHGVTNRTIGGRDNHDPLRGKQQSEAMGEGYSDYFALSMANFRRRRAGSAEGGVYAAWIGNNPATGLRRHAYGAAFPDTYETLRITPNLRAHDAGQVWAQALLRVNETLGAGDPDLGDDLGWLLVMDSLKLLPVGSEAPTFLHGRNALLQAFDATVNAGGIPPDAPLRAAVVNVFTALGMGPAARSPTARYSAIAADVGA